MWLPILRVRSKPCPKIQWMWNATVKTQLKRFWMLIMIVTQIYCDNKDKMNAKFHGRKLEYSTFNLIRIKYLIIAKKIWRPICKYMRFLIHMNTRKYYMSDILGEIHKSKYNCNHSLQQDWHFNMELVIIMGISRIFIQRTNNIWGLSFNCGCWLFMQHCRELTRSGNVEIGIMLGGIYKQQLHIWVLNNVFSFTYMIGWCQ